MTATGKSSIRARKRPGASLRRHRSHSNENSKEKIFEDAEEYLISEQSRGRSKSASHNLALKVSNGNASEVSQYTQAHSQVQNGGSHRHNSDNHGHHPPNEKARIYKRWVFISSLLTFIFAWALFPLVFEYRPRLVDFSKFSEVLFERELFSNLAGGTLFGEQFRGKLMAILKPFSTTGPEQAMEDENRQSPGKKLKLLGAKSHFPVVMIPGVTSTGLELWEGKPCAKSLFRQRLWGTLTMLKTLLMDKDCWIEHLRLDPLTGVDPEGIRLRAAQGLEAADFILPGFWVWARIISNLAEIGYDHNNLYLAAYDWRLDLVNLQLRDHYFTRLKVQIETLRRVRGKKVVIIGHSLGSSVWLYFQKWVEADASKAVDRVGGKDPLQSARWIDHHVEAFVNLAGPLLGAPKAVSTILSGETKDTSQLNTLETYLLDMLLNKQERLSLFRTWMGGFAIFPKGGNRIWGFTAEKGLADDPSDKKVPLIFAKSLGSNQYLTSTNYTYDDIDKIQEMVLPASIWNRYKKNYSVGIATPQDIAKNDLDHRTWINPLESRLPWAPNMKIYCMYGIGHETERAYIYKDTKGNNGYSHNDNRESLNPRNLLLPMTLDLQEEDRAANLKKGIHYVDGDGTVPLLSLGYMCSHGWRKYAHLNPSKMAVIIREHRHSPVSKVSDLRGGPATSDHVDILGNYDLTLDILKIASNYHENAASSTTMKSPKSATNDENEDPVLADKIYSDIQKIGDKVDLKF